MCFDVSELSILFQSMLPVFQSRLSSSPKSTVSAGTSLSLVITSSRSFFSRVVSDVGIDTSPLRQRREITNFGAVRAAACFTLRP